MNGLIHGWRSKWFVLRVEQDGLSDVAPGPIQIGLLGLWLGIVVGLIEVGGLVAVRRITGTITYEILRTNWYYAWMIPVSYVILFGAVGLALGMLGAVWPRRWGFCASACVLSFLVAMALLLAVSWLHWVALLALALGASARVGPWVSARARGVYRVVRWTLPCLVVVVSVLVSWSWWNVSCAERRALAALPEAAPEVPNVLLIVLDTVRFDGAFPAPPARDPTPFLTRVATRGIRFDEARSTAPWTLPSHASLFTGRWPHELSTGVGAPLDNEYPTLAEHLSTQGYATAAFVANTHNGNAWYGLDRGFSRYEDHYENTRVSGLELLRSSRLGSAFLLSRPGQWVVKSLMTTPKFIYRKTAAMINRDTLAWLDHRGERPFFVFLNYYDAHDPYVPPPGAPRPFTSLNPPHDTRPVALQARDAYDDCLAYLDVQLERLFDDLERRGLLKSTVVIITSDHGEGFGEHKISGHGISLYRQELHVPLLVLLPSGQAAGQKIVIPVSLRDIPPTIAELTGSQSASPFPGRSLVRFWQSRAGTVTNDPFLSEVEPIDTQNPAQSRAPTNRGAVKAVVTDGHFFIRNGDGSEELYDLDDDLDESNNEIGEADHNPPVDHFREALDRLLRDNGNREAPLSDLR